MASYKAKIATRIFFRNDDPDMFTYGDKRKVLFSLTDAFAQRYVPLVHAVVPGHVTQSTIKYLKAVSEKTELIEFIQHGWKHVRYRTGEFDESRGYINQLEDIRKGRLCMEDTFGKHSLQAFCAPYGVYTKETYQALKAEGFKAISASVRFHMYRRFFDKFCRLIGWTTLLDKRISYHDRMLQGFGLKEISITVNIMSRSDAFRMRTPKEILKAVFFAERYTKNVGILLHHINMKAEDIPKVEEIIDILKENGFLFCKLSTIYRDLVR